MARWIINYQNCVSSLWYCHSYQPRSGVEDTGGGRGGGEALFTANFYLLKLPLVPSSYRVTRCSLDNFNSWRCTCAIPVPTPARDINGSLTRGGIFVKLCIAQGYLMGTCQRAGGNMTSFQGKIPEALGSRGELKAL